MQDVIIVGTGAAGMTAAIYAQRYNLKVLLIGEKRGGTATEAFQIENFPGFPKITGLELMEKFRQHVESLGIPVKDARVDTISQQGDKFVVRTSQKESFEAKTVILALGTSRRKLSVPGEKELVGKGVAYCATCDAPFFKGKTVAVVGGSDAATMSAVLLSQYCPKIYMIVRGPELKGEPVWMDRVKNNPKVELVFSTNVVAIQGKNKVDSIKLDKAYHGQEALPVDGLFIEIGSVPNIALAKELKLELNAGQRIKIDAKQATSLPGVFAAGDITDRTGHFEQIINSAAQGAAAAYSCFQYLKDKGLVK